MESRWASASVFNIISRIARKNIHRQKFGLIVRKYLLGMMLGVHKNESFGIQQKLCYNFIDLS